MKQTSNKKKIPLKTKSVKKDQGGRPTKYLISFVDQAYKISLLGATDKELSDFFEISESTLNEWKKKYSQFSESIKKGKQIADGEVADKLFKRATGYEHPEVDIKVIKNKIVKTKLIKHYPPETAAGIFWLKNRQKKYWRDKIEQGFSDSDGNDINPVIIQLPHNGRSKSNTTATGVPGETS